MNNVLRFRVFGEIADTEGADREGFDAPLPKFFHQGIEELTGNPLAPIGLIDKSVVDLNDAINRGESHFANQLVLFVKKGDTALFNHFFHWGYPLFDVILPKERAQYKKNAYSSSWSSAISQKKGLLQGF